MRQKIDRTKRLVFIIILIEAAVIAFFWFALKANVLSALVILVLETAGAFLLFDRVEDAIEEETTGVKQMLGSTARQAYLTGEIGMVIYDDDYVVTWMSELFTTRGINRVGHKLLTWIPEADDLIAGRSDTATVRLDDKIYEIRRSEDSQIIFFRDVTEVSTYREKYYDEQIVLGLANFDNYEESVQYADEADTTAITAAVRTPLVEYCNQHGVLARRLNNHNKYLLILNEKRFAELAADHFSILSRVRKTAQKMDVAITLSLAFARGTNDLFELDEMVSNLMDLAQTRGGDQVAVQKVGEEVKYFGGSSEATEKRSRVRVRVMSHALRDLIQQSSNVIICGHKNADFDCIGSAICLSRICSSLHKQVCIIARTGGIEEKLEGAMKANEEILKKEVNFVTEGEAINQLQDNSLVIMTDHHNVRQSNGAKLLEQARKVVVIDHHRRSTDMGVKPVLIYIEAGASSTCELLTEMIPYMSQRTNLSDIDASFMLAGMIIDTQRWRVRTGSRTYDAASVLRKYGADPQTAYDWLRDTFEEFTVKSMAMATAERYPGGVIIAPIREKNMTRSLMSQVADSLLTIQSVQASFVIAQSGSDTCISARSGGRINVQRIMETMGGGGHLSAAAVQRPKSSVDALKAELIAAVEKYLKEEAADESDS